MELTHVVTRYNEFTDLVLLSRVKKMTRKIGIKCQPFHLRFFAFWRKYYCQTYSIHDLFIGWCNILWCNDTFRSFFLIFMFFARILAAEGPKKIFFGKIFLQLKIQLIICQKLFTEWKLIKYLLFYSTLKLRHWCIFFRCTRKS